MSIYAYIRVSTKEQNVDRQYAALQPYHIAKENIYCDHQSGKDFDRPAYRQLMKKIKEGDLIIVKSIDRLGRNYNDILIQWQYITKEIKADILVLDMPLLDTRTKADNLTGTLIADLVLQIFAYVAQTEREFIRSRQAEGIAVAKANGKKLGRDPKQMPADFEKICEACAGGQLTIRQAAKKLNLSHTTFYRHYKLYLENAVSKGRHFGTNKQT